MDDQTKREVAQFDELVPQMMSLIPSQRPQSAEVVCQTLHAIFNEINAMGVRDKNRSARPRLKGVEELTGRY